MKTRLLFTVSLLLLLGSCIESKPSRKYVPQVSQAEQEELLDVGEDSIISLPQPKIQFSELVWKEIYTCLKIDDEFEKNEIIEQKEIDIGDKKLYVVKIEPKVAIEALGNDPIANLIVFLDEHNQYINIPSVYANDFSILEKRQDLVIFEYYSSPVGYTQLILVDLISTELFSSDKIQDTEEIILESIDLSKNEFQIIDEKGNRLKKSFSAEKWSSCN